MEKYFIPNDFLFQLYPDVEIKLPTLKFIWEKKEYVFINIEPMILYNGYNGCSLSKKLPKKLLEYIKPVE